MGSKASLISGLTTIFQDLTGKTAAVKADEVGTEVWDEVTTGSKLSDADGDTYIELEEGADDDHARIYTAGSERLTVDDSGNVGIGTSSPQWNVHVNEGSSSASYINFTNTTTGSGSGNGTVYGINQNEHAIIWNYENTDMIFATNNAAKMRIKPSGNVGIGTNSPGYRLDLKQDVNGYMARFINDGNNANRRGIIIQCGADNGVGATNYILALDGDGNTVGYIEQTAGSVFQLVDSSDERLKSEIKPTEINGIDIVNKIEIDEFCKRESKEKTEAGFVAQKLRKVYPQATSEYENKGETYYGVSEQKLIAPLIKCCQEQQKRIEELEQRLGELNGSNITSDNTRPAPGKGC